MKSVNDTVRLKGIERPVSRIGFGCCPMGGHGWGSTSKAELEEAVRAALDLGINFFDTADVYGLGEAERILGKVLKGQRERAVIGTKFGVRRDGDRSFYDNSPRWIRKALEGSLRRLETDYVDLYQVHYHDKKTPLEQISEVLEELVSEGKTRAIGLTNIDPVEYIGNEGNCPLATYSFEYSLVKRKSEPIVKNLANKNPKLAFLSWGSLGQGLLSGKYGPDCNFAHDDRRSDPRYENFHGDRFSQSLKVVNALRVVSEEIGDLKIYQVALRWILDKLPGSIALVGVKSRRQIEGNTGALGWKLNEEQMECLDAVSSVLL